MVWRGPHPMLLLVLLATWLALARGQPSFAVFQRQHVAPPRTDHQSERVYCNRMMQNRGMTSPVCKFTNTFIHDNINTITNVCGRGGTPAGGNLRESIAHFPLTICRLPGGSQTPPCNYNGCTSYRPIRIGCDQAGLPVHFDGII
ncbi:ribonuclease-like [Emydura macquarii macquarii]|uniref:ribonuclease-like n=1 Tax=Emydura macquarii macquarii TaxID=1129001 RepID=UPI00352B4B88